MNSDGNSLSRVTGANKKVFALYFALSLEQNNIWSVGSCLRLLPPGAGPTHHGEFRGPKGDCMDPPARLPRYCPRQRPDNPVFHAPLAPPRPSLVPFFMHSPFFIPFFVNQIYFSKIEETRCNSMGGRQNR